MKIDRIKGESAVDYKFRICRDRYLYDLDSWDKVADFLNREFGTNMGESAYRKWFTNFNAGYEYSKEKSSDEYLNEIKDQTLEFQKEKVRLQDQKREYNKLIRHQARFEHLKDEISKGVEEVAQIKPLSVVKRPISFEKKSRGIALWSDFHYGSTFKNSFNEYNPDIFRSRFEELLSKTIVYVKRHNVGHLTVANLGDAISGLIHVSTRVQSSEDVIKQIQHIAEYMADALSTLANNVDYVKFVNIIGNHSRTISNKTESIFRENLEYIIPWYLQSRLSHFQNIEIVEDKDGIYMEEVEGESFAYVHGDLDHVTSTAKNLPQMTGVVFKYIFSGHIHHNTVKEYGKTTVVSNGSLMGVDDYAVSKRFGSEPMQKLIILNGSDVECTYDIKFSKV